ncbi:MAG: fasciclin domain-containing protein [Sphingomonas sp.]
MLPTTKVFLSALLGVTALGASAAAVAGQTTPAQPAAKPMTMPMPATPAATPGAPAMSTQGAPAAQAAPNPTVGGAVMDATKPIAVNASAAPNLTTLVTAVKAADLANTLSGPGPFTVFAPTNDAFTRLAPGTVDTLMKPENKATLAKVLTYHVVPGTITLADLKSQITAGGGKATLKTVEGDSLTVTMPQAGAIQIADVNGNKSFLETPDVRQSNGVVHVVNGVLLPKLK